MSVWQETVYPKEKTDAYRMMARMLRSLIEDERDPIANMANMSALLFDALEEINWAGFYLFKKDTLVLGPFQGKPACIRIPLGRGVCGTAAAEGRTVLVRDVHAFAGHIACDGASQSEIVVPLVQGKRLLGVLDIDSPSLARFDEEDQAGLEKMASILKEGCDWPE